VVREKFSGVFSVFGMRFDLEKKKYTCLLHDLESKRGWVSS